TTCLPRKTLTPSSPPAFAKIHYDTSVAQVLVQILYLTSVSPIPPYNYTGSGGLFPPPWHEKKLIAMADKKQFIPLKYRLMNTYNTGEHHSSVMFSATT